MSNTLMRTALTRYRKEVSIAKKGYAQEVYRINHLVNSFLGDLVVSKVTSKDIATYRDQRLATINSRTKRTISNATVRLEMSLLSNFFDIARIEWGFCDTNPVTNVRKPKPSPGRERRISPREERQILRYAHEHPNRELIAIFVLAIETAMRQGELLKMAWEYVNLKSRVVRLPDTKNGSSRDVPLSLRARDVLVGLGQKSSGKVFNYTNCGFKSTWRFMIKKLGIENLHFHDARHEACSRLFELGTLDIMEIAAISGHKSLAMLKRYTHLKAASLARKLEGPKNRAKAAVLSHMVPYPALVQRTQENISIRLLDFDGLEVHGIDIDSVTDRARDALMRKLMHLIRESAPIPSPDQYLDSVDDDDVFMLDPLGADALLQNYRESSSRVL